MSLNANNTTSGDNSSDSASNKNNFKSQLEIVDQKLKKCRNEIEKLNKELEKVWSHQMNDHFKKFYSQEDQRVQVLNSQGNSPEEIKKKLEQLTKKLSSYEKRKQEILFSQPKETQEQEAEVNESNNNSNPVDLNTKNGSNSNLNGALNSNQPNNVMPSTNSTNSFPSLVGPQFNPLVVSSSLPIKTSLTAANRTASFTVTNVNKIMNGDDFQLKSNTAVVTGVNTLGEEKPQFYLNQEGNFKLYNQQNGDVYLNNEDQLDPATTAFLANYKSLQNMITSQGEQIYILKMQHEKIQSDLEDLQKKMDESQKNVIKEIQDGIKSNTDRVSQIMYFMKSLEQKSDDLKATSSQSFQSLQYNFTHYQRDVKEIKEDVSFMKNKVEIVEKNQKNFTESNPTNYYQLFYKLLDIFLTMATIILLAFTNLIASIKFIFLLYPRTFVIFLFFYFLFFYLVDHNKLLLLLNDSSSFVDQFESLDSLRSIHSNNEFSSQSNLTYFGKLFRSVYNLVFSLKRTSTTAT